MDLIVCSNCGEAVAPYYATRGLCDSCKWDTWIPQGYQKRERYRLEPAFGHANRTCRPLLGVEFLDLGCRQVNLEAIYRATQSNRKAFALRLLSQGFTQAEVASEAGVHQGNVSRWHKENKKNLRSAHAECPLRVQD